MNDSRRRRLLCIGVMLVAVIASQGCKPLIDRLSAYVAIICAAGAFLMARRKDAWSIAFVGFGATTVVMGMFAFCVVATWWAMFAALGMAAGGAWMFLAGDAEQQRRSRAW